ncbi:type IV pilus modification protein PilV [Halopseudomonas yangmingensis]|nr:type IV pilus modification protein PilV [Halopseudomonas yangmingensis]
MKMATTWGAAEMNKCKGFTLLELMVTIIIISIGLLGMMAMQGRAIQYSTDTLNRTQAMMLANEMVEILRSQPTRMTATAPLFTGLPTNGAGSCTEISGTDVVNQQIQCWGDRARQLLPGASTADIASQFYACLSTSDGICGAGSAVEIQIAWRGTGEECMLSSVTDTGICTYRVRTQI